ncbi:hypothetical protein [Streptomyces sp. NBC_00648]|uniref:hypothetical protein n=1 Tax=Streptomyces sp. NBC_00648 TaxID=2975797 RepID=UPI002F9149C3
MHSGTDQAGIVRHPLELAREALGLSRVAYARLIADAHEELGSRLPMFLGHPAAPRPESEARAPGPTEQRSH